MKILSNCIGRFHSVVLIVVTNSGIFGVVNMYSQSSSLQMYMMFHKNYLFRFSGFDFKRIFCFVDVLRYAQFLKTNGKNIRPKSMFLFNSVQFRFGIGKIVSVVSAKIFFQEIGV